MRTIFISLLLAATVIAEPFAITDEFVAYLKSAANPHEFGLRNDGRFYPYSTPYGRRIGYRQSVTDKAWFAQGWPKADADRRLRADLEKTLAELRKQPSFDGLSCESQEILLEFAYTEGVTNLKPEFVTAVSTRDWRKLIDEKLYIRMTDGWPDSMANVAFAKRWIYSNKLVTITTAK